MLMNSFEIENRKSELKDISKNMTKNILHSYTIEEQLERIMKTGKEIISQPIFKYYIDHSPKFSTS